MKTKSFLRREEYKALSRITVNGKILDVGGSKKSGYHQLMGGEYEIVTANIDETYGTDLTFDAEKVWPIEDESYDAVLFINVLEHLFQYRTALQEGRRVLRKEGKVIGVVPFMLNVHGSPNDYFRYTRTALEQLLIDEGFTDVHVQELGTGAFSVVYHCLLGFVPWNWLATILIAVCRALDAVVYMFKPNNKMSAVYMPLGYIFEGVRT